MLQKGFLKPQEKKENLRAVRRSRMIFFMGIFLILTGFLALLLRMQREPEEISFVWLILLFGGFLLITVSIWVNFFSQNKTRQR